MNNASYVALSLQVALKRELDIIANNVANANTTGFQADEPTFAEFLGLLEPGGSTHKALLTKFF